MQISQIQRSTVADRNLAASSVQSLGFPVIMAAAMITSYFYTLPLGRYSIGGMFSDIRIYDLMFVMFLFSVGFPRWPSLGQLMHDKEGFFRWSIALLWIIWMSLGMSYAYRIDAPLELLPIIIRIFRFMSYILASCFIIILANNPRRQQFLVSVFYINIVVQALLSFSQAVGWLPPTFWPAYWLTAYGEMPVGTLSPHHLQISIVMLLGIGLSLGFIRLLRVPVLNILIRIFIGIMIAVIFFSGTRTAWIGLISMGLTYLYVYKGEGLSSLIVLGAVLFIFLSANQDLVAKPLENSINDRLINIIETQGPEGLYSERTQIYFRNTQQGIGKRPWILLVGTGFQNIKVSLAGATGAHNNYLQALLELGIVGFIIYTNFLIAIWHQLRRGSVEFEGKFERTLARVVWITFVTVLVTMLFGETLWGQYSTFSLSGQIMSLIGLGVAPSYWSQSRQHFETAWKGLD